MKTICMLFIAFIFFSQVAVSQELKKNKYWVYLAEDIASDCLENEIERLSFSNILNAGVYMLSSQELEEIEKLPCVKEIDKVGVYKMLSTRPNDDSYSFALEQIKAYALRTIGLVGKGVKVGIIDGGFLAADIEPALKHVFEKAKVKDYTDYITPDLKSYEGSKLADDKHGTEVFKLIAGYTDDIRFGLATGATFYLARTDHGSYERRIEEDFVIQAMERFDSLGVHIINISLGYTNGFDNPNENYSPQMMDGKTSALTRAVDHFVKDRNILVIVAAGNDGNNSWQVISAPADAKHALTVGATGYKYWTKADFSSVGPQDLGYIKPEVACFSNIGTSFSAPVVTGLAACIKQYDLSISASAIKEMIMKSSHLHPYGNNYIGYGVPDCEKIVALIRGNNSTNVQLETIPNAGIKHNTEDSPLVVFYKKDSINVISQGVYYQGKVKIKKREKEKFITIVKGNSQTLELKTE